MRPPGRPRRVARGHPGRGHRPARPERRRQVEPRARGRRRPARRGREGHARRRRPHVTASGAHSPGGRGHRARGPPPAPVAHRARQPRRRHLLALPVRRQGRPEAGTGALPRAREAPRGSRPPPLGRRAADARAGPGARLEAEVHVHRRALARPRARGRPAPAAHDPRGGRRRSRSAPDRAVRHGGARASPSAPTSWRAAGSSSRGWPASCGRTRTFSTRPICCAAASGRTARLPRRPTRCAGPRADRVPSAG